jgi:ketosteroid isomerase-like protein
VADGVDGRIGIVAGRRSGHAGEPRAVTVPLQRRRGTPDACGNRLEPTGDRAMWLTETPWPPAFVLAASAVVAGLFWRRTGRTGLLGLAIACLLLIPVAFLVERAIVTPSEEIELRILAIRDAVIRDDLEATLAFFGSTAVREKTLVTMAMTAGDVHPDARVTDVDVDVKADGTLATSHFRANGTFSGRGPVPLGDHRFATRWRASWRKEGGDWKIFALERLNPINGEPIGYLSAD